ncbi:hypothetical protein VKT23_000199 [Stygiomarasmius scandens]|uniref:Uncharacterized protein n=1 Tax=Marasmiellus scandens TaxID=2682957 RepID=A0ABR1K3E4_9AGAR
MSQSAETVLAASNYRKRNSSYGFPLGLLEIDHTLALVPHHPRIRSTPPGELYLTYSYPHDFQPRSLSPGNPTTGVTGGRIHQRTLFKMSKSSRRMDDVIHVVQRRELYS